jgi:hypothetical protein
MLRRRGDHARRLSEHERRELQRRVAAGETFASAAAAVGCSTKSIQRLLARTGGLERRAQERSPLRLSPADREELSRGLVAGDSLRQIAGRLGRVASTLSREVERNGGRTAYRACHGETAAARRARRPKPAKLALHSRLRREVERRLLERWSPQQIAARLVYDYPDDPTSASRTKPSIARCCAGPWRSPQGTDGLSAYPADPAPLSQADRALRHRATPGHGAHQQTARRSRGPRDPWPLGGRSAHGERREVRDWDARRAIESVRGARALA